MTANRMPANERLEREIAEYTGSMTTRDVLITRVHDALGSPMFASPNATREQPVEQLWAVTAEGHQSLSTHPFTEALDVALTWAGELGGEIYRCDRPGDRAALYKAAW